MIGPTFVGDVTSVDSDDGFEARSFLCLLERCILAKGFARELTIRMCVHSCMQCLLCAIYLVAMWVCVSVVGVFGSSEQGVDATLRRFDCLVTVS